LQGQYTVFPLALRQGPGATGHRVLLQGRVNGQGGSNPP